MEKFTITSPIITTETKAEKALIKKWYPTSFIGSTTAQIPGTYTLEELNRLKVKLFEARRCALMGQFRAMSIFISLLNKKQAAYLMGRSKNNEIYDYTGDAIIDDLDESQGPWDANIQEVLTPEQIVTLFEELNNLK